MVAALLKKRSWWEGHLIDLWTIPHTISGALIAYGLVLLGFDALTGLVISVVVAILWELFEKVTHISDIEHRTNGASDVCVAQVGYVLGTWFFSTYQETGITLTVLAMLGIIFIAVSVLGWLSHHWYGEK